MAKKQKSFADKASSNKNAESVYVKYVKSVKSEKSGQWRFNEQMVRTSKGEQLDAALKRMDEVANLIDIDLSQFSGAEALKEESLKTEAPKEEAPKQEAPKEEAPKEEAPKTEAPKIEASEEEAPKTEAPKEGSSKD